jgi:hypothetical protein
MELIHGEHYHTCETAGCAVPEGFTRFWYAEYINRKFSYSAPIDCVSKEVFEEWLKRTNNRFDDYEYEYREHK